MRGECARLFRPTALIRAAVLEADAQAAEISRDTVRPEARIFAFSVGGCPCHRSSGPSSARIGSCQICTSFGTSLPR